MIKNPKIEISGKKDDSWIRVRKIAIKDDRDEARKAMLEDPKGQSHLYTLGDGIFEVFRIENPECIKYSITSTPIVIEE